LDFIGNKSYRKSTPNQNALDVHPNPNSCFETPYFFELNSNMGMGQNPIPLLFTSSHSWVKMDVHPPKNGINRF
jgi:hypothetical protein